jgi:hypothetical protein
MFQPEKTSAAMTLPSKLQCANSSWATCFWHARRVGRNASAQSSASDVWCIFDNTVSGAATANALDIQTRLDFSR